MPPQAIAPAPVYQQLAQVLEYLGLTEELIAGEQNAEGRQIGGTD